MATSKILLICNYKPGVGGISGQVERKVGHRLRVIIDSETDQYYIGRTEWDSPEVDPEVLIEKSRPLTIGEFCDVEITEALPFELVERPGVHLAIERHRVHGDPSGNGG